MAIIPHDLELDGLGLGQSFNMTNSFVWKVTKHEQAQRDVDEAVISINALSSLFLIALIFPNFDQLRRTWSDLLAGQSV